MFENISFSCYMYYSFVQYININVKKIIKFCVINCWQYLCKCSVKYDLQKDYKEVIDVINVYKKFKKYYFRYFMEIYLKKQQQKVSITFCLHVVEIITRSRNVIENDYSHTTS